MTTQRRTESLAAQVIDGKAAARHLRDQVKARVADLVQNHGVQPGLDVILVGDDPASAIYVASKEKVAAAAGMRGRTHLLPANTTQKTLMDLIASLNADSAVHGILLQLPLPAHLDADVAVQAIAPAKDVDGLHVENMGRLMAGAPALVPCTPQGCMMLIKSVRPDIAGLHAVVIGRSALVGRPVAQLLLQANCTVTMAHSRTQDLPAVARMADILVCAAGRAGLVRADWVKDGAIVIDVGIIRQADKIVGDVDYESVAAKAGAITPVPGGVGPMTPACLLANTVVAACRQHGLDVPVFDA